MEENKRYTAWQLETQEAKLNAEMERRWIGPSLKNKRQAFAFSAWRSEARQRRKTKETQFWKVGPLVVHPLQSSFHGLFVWLCAERD